MRSKGEGTIYKRNGRYIGQYYTQDCPPKRKTVSGKTKKEVQDKLVQIRHEMKEGTYMDTEKMQFGEFVKDFMENYKKNEIQRTTYDGYLDYLEKHVYPNALAKERLGEITVNMMQKYYNQRTASGMSSRSIRYLHSILNGAFKNACKRNLIRENPNKDVTLPRKVTKEICPPTVEEVKKFLEHEKESPLYGLWRIYVLNGLRRSEGLAIQKKDINWETGEIRLHYAVGYVRNDGLEESNRKHVSVLKEDMKNKASLGSIFVDDETLEVLRRTVEVQEKRKRDMGELWNDKVLFMSTDNKFSMVDNDLLFTKEDGYFISGRSVLDALHKSFEECGIPRKRVHDLRHFYGTECMYATGDLKMTSELMRHKQVSTTAGIYLHTSNQRKKEAQDTFIKRLDL